MSFATAKNIGGFVFALLASLAALRQANEPLYLNLSIFIACFLLLATIFPALFSGVRFKARWNEFSKLWYLHCAIAVPVSVFGLAMLGESISILNLLSSFSEIGKSITLGIGLATMQAYGANLIWHGIKDDFLGLIKSV